MSGGIFFWGGGDYGLFALLLVTLHVLIGMCSKGFPQGALRTVPLPPPLYFLECPFSWVLQYGSFGWVVFLVGFIWF